jgi:hypothetical protein
MSNREELIDIISMAQQANPNDIGQIEFLRAQLIAWSRLVVMMPSWAAACSTLALSNRENSSAGPLAIGASIPLFCHERLGERGC